VDQLIAALDSDVIEPVRRFQRLIARTTYMTRLYTTLSAAEMLVDPVFRFNPDLPGVSNQHVATRVTECRSDLDASEAPWRIEFGDGAVLRGAPGSTGQWPEAVAAQPANQRVLMLSTAGEGRVVADNSDQIATSLAEYNAQVPRAPDRGGFCSLQSAPEMPRSGGAWSFALVALAALGWLRRRNPR
jgi:MYXO-CTERM domain-containing protein